MKSIHNSFKMAFCLGLMFVICILSYPTNAPAESDMLVLDMDNFSFDDCEPFEAQVRIMAVDGIKAQLSAGEKTIYVVDLDLGGQRLITELTDADGNHMDFGALERGQWIHVEGFEHIDGGVVASMVHQIAAPEYKKPVVREISIKNRKPKRIKRHLGAKQE